MPTENVAHASDAAALNVAVRALLTVQGLTEDQCSPEVMVARIRRFVVQSLESIDSLRAEPR